MIFQSTSYILFNPEVENYLKLDICKVTQLENRRLKEKNTYCVITLTIG